VSYDARMRVYVAFGSNVGNREENIASALGSLRRIPHTSISAVSTSIETTPVDCPPGSADFLNGVVELETELSARELLMYMHRIEAELGRERGVKNAPRTIDLDLILFGNEIIAEPDLIVPHPRMRERAFVLDPLLALAPDIRDPETGQRYADIRRELHA
jgi:2-amino-4-hydroxy-6-hydroxymethyldihydropteridine diphosphokinase